MTTITHTAALPVERAEAPRRIIAVTRLHFVNKFQILIMPILLVIVVLLLNIAIWGIILLSVPADVRDKTSQGFSYSGAVASIFIYCMIIAVQAVNRTFPLALGFGVTRRDFYLGSVLAFTTLAMLFSIVLTILSELEDATHGWGLGGHMFNPDYFAAQSWGARFALYLLIFLFFLFIGSAVASVYVRWKTTGLVTFFVIVAAVIVGAIAIITLGQHWGSVTRWFGDTGALGIATWSLVPTAIAGFAGYFLLRRATPKG
jgi:hypothetical protein